MHTNELTFASTAGGAYPAGKKFQTTIIDVAEFEIDVFGLPVIPSLLDLCHTNLTLAGLRSVLPKYFAQRTKTSLNCITPGRSLIFITKIK